MFKRKYMLMMLGAGCYRNEMPDDGGEGGAGSSREPSSILAGAGNQQEQTPPDNTPPATPGRIRIVIMIGCLKNSESKPVMD